MLSAIRTSDYLGVRIHAAPNTGVSAKPLNLAFLFDVSESMLSDNRLESVKRTLHAARNLFTHVDQVTLVIFGEHAAVVTDHLVMNADGIRTFYEKVDDITVAGCTNLSEGVELIHALQAGKPPYDAVVILTDGIINRGITTLVGMRTMVKGLGSMPITTLGYGADHNRTLLRDIALNSRGSYVYVDAESILPAAMGDLIEGLRSEVLCNASLQVPSGWVCCELGSSASAASSASSYVVGNIVPDRDYWVVFRRSNENIEATPITLSADRFTETLDRVVFSDCQDLQEQVLRCRVAKAIADASEQLENGRPTTAALAELETEFDTLPDIMKARPLILRMRAQIAEILEQQMNRPSFGAPPPDFLARISSGAAYLSTQRGVSRQVGEDPTESQNFSSPCQRLRSQQVQSQYTAI
jgi:hypothetical protein